MKLQATEITEIIKQHITDYESKVDIAEIGTVIQASDGIARIYGLENAMSGELLEFPHGVRGMVLNDGLRLVIDATTGQNGLQQAREFTDAVDVTSSSRMASSGGLVTWAKSWLK